MARSRRNRTLILTGAWLGLLVALSATGCGGGDAAESSTHSAGVVTLVQFGSSSGGFLAWADFQRDSAAPTCTTQPAADCTFYRCITTESAASTPVPDIDAGTVTVTAAQTVTLTRASNGNYPDGSSQGILFEPGQAIGVDIQGNGIDPPPFATTLVGPGPITLLSPTGFSAEIDRVQDFTLSWAPAAGDYVAADIGTSDDGGRVTCMWPMSAGQGVVPASVLGAMGPGTITLFVQSESLVDRRISEWRFLVSARVPIAYLDLTLD